METTGNRPGDDGEGHDDRRLVEELESLYHEVARSDHPDTELGQRIGGSLQVQISDGLHQTGAISGLDPDAEIRRRLGDRKQPTREELVDRLHKIKGAYEMMLTYWPYAAGGSSITGMKKT